LVGVDQVTGRYGQLGRRHSGGNGTPRDRKVALAFNASLRDLVAAFGQPLVHVEVQLVEAYVVGRASGGYAAAEAGDQVFRKRAGSGLVVSVARQSLTVTAGQDVAAASSDRCHDIVALERAAVAAIKDDDDATRPCFISRFRATR
jgi:hypothetical protein